MGGVASPQGPAGRAPAEGHLWLCGHQEERPGPSGLGQTVCPEHPKQRFEKQKKVLRGCIECCAEVLVPFQSQGHRWLWFLPLAEVRAEIRGSCSSGGCFLASHCSVYGDRTRQQNRLCSVSITFPLASDYLLMTFPLLLTGLGSLCAPTGLGWVQDAARGGWEAPGSRPSSPGTAACAWASPVRRTQRPKLFVGKMAATASRVTSSCCSCLVRASSSEGLWYHISPPLHFLDGAHPTLYHLGRFSLLQPLARPDTEGCSSPCVSSLDPALHRPSPRSPPLVGALPEPQHPGGCQQNSSMLLQSWARRALPMASPLHPGWPSSLPITQAHCCCCCWASRLLCGAVLQVLLQQARSFLLADSTSIIVSSLRFYSPFVRAYNASLRTTLFSLGTSLHPTGRESPATAGGTEQSGTQNGTQRGTQNGTRWHWEKRSTSVRLAHCCQLLLHAPLPAGRAPWPLPTSCRRGEHQSCAPPGPMGCPHRAGSGSGPWVLPRTSPPVPLLLDPDL